jgi:hypothetical protein
MANSYYRGFEGNYSLHVENPANQNFWTALSSPNILVCWTLKMNTLKLLRKLDGNILTKRAT